jgi:hypothetical protein
LLSSSPKLFAANHVLHRLLPPRHPPFALCSLTNGSFSLTASPVRTPPYFDTSRRSRAAPAAQHMRQTSCPDTLDTEIYSIIKDRRTLVRLPTCIEPAALEGRCRILCGDRPQLPIPHRVHVPQATRIGSGGADRDRTDDLRLAKPALSQLSYSPRIVRGNPTPLPKSTRTDHGCARSCSNRTVQLVGLGGFEPPTSRLSGGRSNQLSYRPAMKRRGL